LPDIRQRASLDIGLRSIGGWTTMSPLFQIAARCGGVHFLLNWIPSKLGGLRTFDCRKNPVIAIRKIRQFRNHPPWDKIKQCFFEIFEKKFKKKQENGDFLNFMKHFARNFM
jgi:hypothetical protein